MCGQGVQTITIFILMQQSALAVLICGQRHTKRENASLNSDTCSSVNESACQSLISSCRSAAANATLRMVGSDGVGRTMLIYASRARRSENLRTAVVDVKGKNREHD